MVTFLSARIRSRSHSSTRSTKASDSGEQVFQISRCHRLLFLLQGSFFQLADPLGEPVELRRCATVFALGPVRGSAPE